MCNLNIFRRKKKDEKEVKEVKEVKGIRPTFHSTRFGPNLLSFSFTPHAKEILRCDIPEEGKNIERGKRMDEKKVKAHGKRGRGKGATE